MTSGSRSAINNTLLLGRSVGRSVGRLVGRLVGGSVVRRQWLRTYEEGLCQQITFRPPFLTFVGQNDLNEDPVSFSRPFDRHIIGRRRRSSRWRNCIYFS